MIDILQCNTSKLTGGTPYILQYKQLFVAVYYTRMSLAYPNAFNPQTVRHVVLSFCHPQLAE